MAQRYNQNRQPSGGRQPSINENFGGRDRECDPDIEVELWGECYNIETTYVINLYNAGLTGSIPPEIGNLTNLISLNLGNNNLTGDIPPEVWTLENLTYLSLHSNELTGEIPSSIGNLTNLILLNLSSNQLTGEIPIEICNFDWDWKNLGPGDFWIVDNYFCFPYPYCIEDHINVPGEGGQDTSDCPYPEGYNVNDIQFLEELVNIISPYHGQGFATSNWWELGIQQWQEIDGEERLVSFECYDIPGMPDDFDLVGSCPGAWWGLNGTLPENISNVTYLTELNLRNNNYIHSGIIGPLPTGLCTLSDDYLYVMILCHIVLMKFLIFYTVINIVLKIQYMVVQILMLVITIQMLILVMVVVIIPVMDVWIQKQIIIIQMQPLMMVVCIML